MRNVFLIVGELIQRIRIKFIKNELHYVNGNDMLPPPLTQTEEERLICCIECEEARDILIEHNLRLVAYIAKRFENTGANIEELISIGTVGLIKAISSFNADKNIRLATYASRCIENEILMFIRKTSQQRREVSIDEPLSVDWDGNELLLSDVLGSDSDIVTKEVADALGISQSYISRLEKKIMSRLRKKIEEKM